MAEKNDDDDDDNNMNYMIEDDNHSSFSLPPAKRIKIANDERSPSSVTADSVKVYLNEHPDFLNSYIQQNIHSDTIEQWITKKPSKVSSSSSARPSSSSTTIPLVSSNQNNVSTPPINHTNEKRKNSSDSSKQLSLTTAKSMNTLVELSDKRRLLHELTDEVNQNVSKAQILYELNKSIATTVSADGFNLYLVDETDTNLRLFSSENDDEQAACFIPIRIGSGHCLAGYVAWSKETIRISDMTILDMEKYPDGLYVKDNKVTAVMAHPIINTTGNLLGVVEFYRVNNPLPFSIEDEEVSSSKNCLFTCLIM
ncbi:hypothetical protein I4U23_014748 [Adineta vaga]|nr:hypothetical protein I4U23_014748 [Adineta vaga]